MRYLILSTLILFLAACGSEGSLDQGFSAQGDSFEGLWVLSSVNEDSVGDVEIAYLEILSAETPSDQYFSASYSAYVFGGQLVPAQASSGQGQAMYLEGSYQALIVSSIEGGAAVSQSNGELAVETPCGNHLKFSSSPY